MRGVGVVVVLLVGCSRPVPPSAQESPVPVPEPQVASEDGRVEARPAPIDLGARDPPEARNLRARLVAEIAMRRDVRTPAVRAAMESVPRHLFAGPVPLRLAYGDFPLGIGHGQTISQPTIVAIMTEALQLGGRERVLEIGTGSGYQAAVLSLLAAEVDTIEIVPELAETARARLAELGYRNVRVHVGDGWKGVPAHAPYDRIIVTAAPPEIPAELVRQLADGGILVAPIGEEGSIQRLVRLRKSGARLVREDLGDVRFVPMVHAD